MATSLKLSRGIKTASAGVGRLNIAANQLSRSMSTMQDPPMPVRVSKDARVQSETSPSTSPAVRWLKSDTDRSGILNQAIDAPGPRNTWTREEIAAIYSTPLMELVFSAATLHRRFFDPASIQLCTLMNIKTGGCSEDCSYCAQSSRYKTGIKPTKLSSVDEVLAAARIAKENGSTRFCMGAAWRDMRGRKTNLKNIKLMVMGVRDLGMEACVTLGMIDKAQADELKGAGLTAYNHNVDTSREHYPNVITTRSYDERLQTIDNVRQAGINVCSGGILGLGEKPRDHVGLIHTVSTMPSHPESFPVNALVPIKGTPLGDAQATSENPEPPISFDATVRTIATARLVLPTSVIRLAAGRINLNEAQQMMCFMAGANAIFTGEKMLTTPCSGWDEDKAMFDRWGLRPMEPEELHQARNQQMDERQNIEKGTKVKIMGQSSRQAASGAPAVV